MTRTPRLPPRRLLTIAAGAVLFLLLHRLAWALQTQVMRPLQEAAGIVLPYALIDLAHGLRILFAWFFGVWSLIVLLPATLWIYADAVRINGIGHLTAGFHLVAVTYLLSGPAAFALLRLALGEAGHPVRLEWRMILLAGLLSAFLNAVAYGLLRPPDADARDTLIWLLAVILSQGFGVLAVLLGLLWALRALGRTLRRGPD